MEEIQNDHPRSAAIVGATYLEDVTQLGLLTKMIDLSKDERDRLFVGSSPLSSFSAKIQMAYALGIIGPKARHDLDTIREIRNVFAHAKVSVTFQTDAVANAISGLHFGGLASEWKTLSPQSRFAVVVNTLMVYLISNWTEQTTDMKTVLEFDPPKPMTPISFAE